MSDQFVTITRTGWLGNIMNSFVGVLLGIILWAIARSKRNDPETQNMVEAVAKSGAD